MPRCRVARCGAVLRNTLNLHHKFAVFDDDTLVTGSYNWTRGAAERNEENFLVSQDPRLVRIYADKFEDLWEAFE